MKIITGIASTTHVDRHNERLTKRALEGMADQIKETLLPQLVNHDWNRLVGVILYGEVFQLDDGEFALGIVSGVFESQSEKESFKPEQSNTSWEFHRKHLDVDRLKLLNARNHRRPNVGPEHGLLEQTLANKLEAHLDSTGVMPDGTVYKTKLLVTRVKDLRIEVYPRDHAPKHFHVISKQRGMNARFDIRTLELVSIKHGKISARDVKKVRHFFDTRPDMLEKLITEHSRMN